MSWLAGLLLLLLSAVPALAQPWAGILAPNRATDWTTVGVKILGQSPGIPTNRTQCGSTIVAYTGTAATINNAIGGCGTNQFVLLGAGTFTLSTGIDINRSNVTLRGAGASSTRIVINGNSGGCGDFRGKAVTICQALHYGTNAGGFAGPQHTANWTAGYAKGTTVVTLSSTTGLEVGSMIMLDQLDDTVTDGLTDGWPGAGDILNCQSGIPCAAEGGGTYNRVGRTHVETHQVTAINGLNVTIDPPIHSPDYRASPGCTGGGGICSPGAWWGNLSGGSTAVSQNVGIENLAVDFAGSGNTGLYAANCLNCWVKNTRWIFVGGPGSFVFHIAPIQTLRFEVRDSYFYGPTTQGNTQYTYAPHIVGSNLFENNILHRVVTPITGNDPDVGSVIGYNYIDGGYYSSWGEQKHHSGDAFVLSEGNNYGQMYSDNNHGNHYFHTMFRNHLDRDAHGAGSASCGDGVALLTHSRFWNLIANVIGHTSWTIYVNATPASYFNGCGGNDIYTLGWIGNCGSPPGTGGSQSCSQMPNDTHVPRTLMRWGNYDSVTNAVRFVAGEVPSGIANFANPVPASQAFPPSFYRAVKPSDWWAPNPAWGVAEPPWPPIGPDVTGGPSDAVLGNGTRAGGHANKIPARLCFENTAVDPAYPASNPRVLLFSADACYFASSGGTFDFFLSTSGDKSVTQGGGVITIVTVSLISGSSSVVLSASGLPAGTSASFAPGSCTPSCQSTLTIQTLAGTTPNGVSTVTVTGTAGPVVRTATFALSVSAIWPPIIIFPVMIR